MGIKKAKTKEVRRLTAAELGGAPAARSHRAGPDLRSRTNQDGRNYSMAAPKEAAAKLVEKLRSEARVL